MIGFGPILAQRPPDVVAAQGYADMILVNGKIAAMDDRIALRGYQIGNLLSQDRAETDHKDKRKS